MGKKPGNGNSSQLAAAANKATMTVDKVELRLKEVLETLQTFTLQLEQRKPVHVEAGKASGMVGIKMKEIQKAMDKEVSKGLLTISEEEKTKIDSMTVSVHILLTYFEPFC
jgi:hypothetical protein